jgi:hypothetical protein
MRVTAFLRVDECEAEFAVKGKGMAQVRNQRKKNQGEEIADFFLTSPKSKAAITPTTIYVSSFSFKHATTNGKLFLLFPPRLLATAVPGSLSRRASTSHSASRERTPGWAKSVRSGPWVRITTRWERIVRMSCLSIMDVP